MSVLPPPSPDDNEAFQEQVQHEVEQVTIPEEMPAPQVKGRPIKDVCAVCKRPIGRIPQEGTWNHLTQDRYSSGWFHWDAKIDHPTNAAHHEAVLFVEPPVRWGFLSVRGSLNIESEPKVGSKGGMKV